MAGLIPNLTKKHLNILFMVGATLIAVGMPFSIALMSIGAIWVSSVYILEGGFRAKFINLRHPVLWPILGLGVVFFSGLLWTEDLPTGINEIKKILPLFVIPVVFSGISPVSRKQRKGLVWVFVAATFLSVLIDLGVGYYKNNLFNGKPRDISLFVSHIRLSLYIVFSVIWVCYSKLHLWIKILVSGVFLLFLSFTQTITGVVLLMALSSAMLVGVLKIKNTKSIAYFRWSFLAILLVGVGFIAYTVVDFYTVSAALQTPKLTQNGKPYNPEIDNGFIENGNYLWSYVSYSELERGFRQNTDQSVWSLNDQGKAHYVVLVRYLNNLGLTKDSVGISKMTDKDFLRVLDGETYPKQWKYTGFSKRIRGMLFHFEKSRFSTDFSGNSIAEKMVFQQAGWCAYKNNPLIGAGTGDLKQSLGVYYDEYYPLLKQEKRRKPHNQFLTYLVMFGPVAAILLLFIFVQFWRYTDKSLINISRAFAIIALVSCLSEDTLGSQAGVTFVGYFVGLLVLLRTDN